MFDQLSSLEVFYLIVAMLILAVVLVYWADAIRGKKKR